VFRSLLEKIGYGALVLWGVASVVFFLFNILPGDPARMMLDQRDDEELLNAVRAKYGLDEPIGIQYINYINDLSPLSLHSMHTGDYSHQMLSHVAHRTLLQMGNKVLVIKLPYLRESFQQQGKSVAAIIRETLPNTALLALASITLALIVGLVIGILAAIWRNSFFDRFWSVFGTLGMSLPSFFTAILFAWLFAYVLSAYTGLNLTGSLYAVNDYTGERYIQWKNMILPALTLGIRPLGVIIQLSRSAMLDVLSQDFIRTARAKGLTQFQIIWRHALRNALNPVVTTVSGWFASLLAGAVFVEFIFAWNGLGKQIVDALNLRDLPVVMGAVLVIAALFTLINILVDIIYGILDPRVRSA
jgi:peptide/nickel transport system permease protein